MCGNFGLLSLGYSPPAEGTSHHNDSFHKPQRPNDNLDQSLSASMHEVSKLGGGRFRDPNQEEGEQEEMISPLKVLEAQTACTEIRGGQAGGYSSIEYKYVHTDSQSRYDALFNASVVAVPLATRVRMVARKRHPLAADLSALYLRQRLGKMPDPKSTISVIGHTRFATSSINQVSELHPHEWVPFHEEPVWLFSSSNGKFEKVHATMGLHISHNGDFDAMEAYSQVMVVDEVGLWLERVLHVSNSTRGDSPKVAGCMDMLRVQGRWGASARLAWVRVILQAATEVAGGEQLAKAAPNTFPPPAFWAAWGEFLDAEWTGHINNIVKVSTPTKFELKKKRSYALDAAGVKQLEDALFRSLTASSDHAALGHSNWSALQLQSFLHFAVRGFLRGDLYNAMSELLSRAEGSFGLQAHCTLEPGVVVIASKGQPMSIAFDPAHPIALFASEAEALAVPVFKSGRWLPERIDLDSHGEIVRLGEPRALQEGQFFGGVKASKRKKPKKSKKAEATDELQPLADAKKKKLPFILLDCGLEIRSYSLVTCMESSMEALSARSVSITSAPNPYDPKADLVAEDLRVTPAVLSAIDRAWSNDASLERIAGQSLAEYLVRAMQRRLSDNKDTTDLLIGGVEVSLWMGEQFAADLRRIFPTLNISTLSANKLVGAGDDNPSKVFFPVSDELQTRKIDKNTCVLLISQSGQTFPTLHATKKMAKFVPGRLWILTGCFHSKMEQGMMEGYCDSGLTYGRDRVFNNYSGHRPAEPSSVAVAATWHTLTRLLLHVVQVTRQRCPGGRVIHPWDCDAFAAVIQRFFIHFKYAFRKKLKQLRDNQEEEERSEFELLAEKQKGDGTPRKPLELVRVGSLLGSWRKDNAGEKGKEEAEDEDIGADLPQVTESTVTYSPSRAVSIKAADRLSAKSRQSSSKQYKIRRFTQSSPQVVMNLSDGCIEDVTSLLQENLIPNICQIVGHDSFGRPIRDADGRVKEGSTYEGLVTQGKAWAAHINETWHMLVLAGIYIFFSVGLGLSIFALIGDAILAIIRAGGAPIGPGALAFTPRFPHIMYNQPIGFTLVGLFLQFVDALFFIYLAKNFTRLTRIIHGRPLAARHGKRTIVIVDNPCVHQLTEIFVSKLFSQAYSFVSVDVHGASGLDHFVHRFTHRVVRGVLIAVGRPDGRLGCLAKSEAAVILAAKQAAFICNPDYKCQGSGPEIVTVGHNPYEPNVGLAHHIVLHGGAHQASALASVHNVSVHNTSQHSQPKLVIKQQNRRKFVDEYLYDRLFLAQKPFTTSILRSLRRAMDSGQAVVQGGRMAHRPSLHNLSASVHSASLSASVHSRKRRATDEPLPYGVHHIDPSILVLSESIESSVFADFVMANRELLKPHILKDVEALKGKSFDPAVRSAFSAKLDSQTRQIQDLQVIVQHFYECRIASLERYIAFCVMFHTMAAECCKPWLMHPWDIARSQSNLRVATTASPISAGGGEGHATSQEVKKLAHQMAFNLRKIHVNF